MTLSTSDMYVLLLLLLPPLLQGLPSLEEGQERSLLAEPLDPELQEAYSLTDIGPRVALLTGLYQLAAAAGLADPGAGDSSSGDNTAGGALSESWVLEVEAAGVGLWSYWLQVGWGTSQKPGFAVLQTSS
jgi:hypothetical protein